MVGCLPSPPALCFRKCMSCFVSWPQCYIYCNTLKYGVLCKSIWGILCLHTTGQELLTCPEFMSAHPSSRLVVTGADTRAVQDDDSEGWESTLGLSARAENEWRAMPMPRSCQHNDARAKSSPFKSSFHLKCWLFYQFAASGDSVHECVPSSETTQKLMLCEFLK